MTALRQQPVSENPSQVLAGNSDFVALDPGWAWDTFVPDAQRPWNGRLAGHLLCRAGFGANWEQLERAISAGPGPTIDRLVRPPAEALAQDDALEGDEDAVARASGMESLRAWWLRRMIQTGHPLREKMTLFWHSHFGVSHVRVKDVSLMVQHVRTLRQHALGSYRELLEGIPQDAAVLLALGADANRKAAPNELFPRQLLERFGLGTGRYGEEDVREAARAFTGWFVMRGRLRFFDHEFDGGPKRVLGQEGPWKSEDIVRIVLEQPAAPRLLARTLFRWLISEVGDPGDELIEPLATQLGQQYDVGAVVETMLRSNLFFSEHALRRRIKSPVDYAVGMVLAFDALVPTLPLGAALAELGQDLYAPPTTAGWLGGQHWLNAATMIARANLAEALLSPGGPYGGKVDPAAVTRRCGASGMAEQISVLARLLLHDDVTPAGQAALSHSDSDENGPASDTELRRVAYQIATLPEFQLS